MSVSTHQPEADFLFACLDEYRRESLPDGKFSRRLWIEKVAEFIAAWHASNDPKKVKRVVKQTDDEWIEGLQADPLFAGVDVRKELGKAQFWCRENGRQCTRKFFTNWLNKADRNLAANGTTTRKPVAVNAEPVGWLVWMRANRPDWIRFIQEKEGHPLPSWPCLSADERNYIVAQLR